MALHFTASVSTLGGPVIFIDLRGIYFGSYSEALSKLSFISAISTKENWFVKSFKCSKTEELSSNMTQPGSPSQPVLNPPAGILPWLYFCIDDDLWLPVNF